MPAFRVSGSTGQAPTTVWFGKVPDRFNMLLPHYRDSASNENYFTGMYAVNYANQMIVWDQAWAAGGASTPSCSLGSTAVAPDGTSTAYKVIEGTNTGLHILTAASNDNQQRWHSRKRFAAFVKAGERTRCWMAISNGSWAFASGGASDSGVRVVFDLAGGQIGVAAAKYGAETSWDVVDAEINPYGSGWYLCKLDVVTPNNYASSAELLSCAIGPDSGSGTGALSNSYAGNGTSGIYVWRVNLLPPRAYGLNNDAFFTDFNDDNMAEIDITNSRVPGFKWYTNNSWAEYGYDDPVALPPCGAFLSVANSILKIGKVNSPAFEAKPETASYDGAGGYVGNVFQPSGVFECRCQCFMNNPTGGFAFWATGVESLTKPGNPTTPPTISELTEIDFMEIAFIPSDRLVPQFAYFDPQFHQQNFQTQQGFLCSLGIPVWLDAVEYGVGTGVSYNGVIYKALGTTTGDQPDISPTSWEVYTPVPTMPTTANTLMTDFNQMHTYSYIWLNDNSALNGNDCGEFLCFFDETFTFSYVGSINNVSQGQGGWNQYGANIFPNTIGIPNSEFVSADHRHFPLFLSGGGTLSDFYIDFARVIQ